MHTGSGYVTVRLTYEEIVCQPVWTAGELKRVLTTWAPHLLVA